MPNINVEIVATMEDALKMADRDNNLYPAKIAGPVRSSEGLVLFYIIKIL